jgi:hypothetical protein
MRRKCPICDNAEVNCKQCDFVYASNIPEQAAFDAY